MGEEEQDYEWLDELREKARRDGGTLAYGAVEGGEMFEAVFLRFERKAKESAVTMTLGDRVYLIPGDDFERALQGGRVTGT